MRISSIQQLILIAASALALQAAPVLAADPSPTTPPPPGAASPDGWDGYGEVDWVAHTQRMLDDLKTKLDLSAEQQPAWDQWSGDVVANVRSQTEKVHQWREEHMKLGPMEDPAHTHRTTPERMAHGLEHMRAEIKRMQDHVALLETALNNTKTFYETLGPKQKTIFDLYWQQSYQGGWIGHGMTGHHHESYGGHAGAY